MKVLRFAVITAVLITFAAASSFAVTNYTEFNSPLVSDTITTIEMDPSGSIWIGTDIGVSRFNGLEWKTYRNTNAQFPTEFINDIMPDNLGNIYFATTGGVSVFDSPKWEIPSMDGIPSPDVESLIMDSNEDIWLGTGGGLAKYRNFKITETFTMANSDIPSDFVRQIALDSFQVFWLATGFGVSEYDGNLFTNYNALQGLPADNIKSIAVEIGPTDDIIWVATAAGVGKRESSSWTKLTVANTLNGLLEDDVRYVLVDYQNNKWFATATKGVSQLTSGSTWVDYTFNDGNLIDDRATTVAIDNSENIWIGTEGGVTKVGDNAIISFHKILNLNLDAVSHVTVIDPLMNLDPNTEETLTVRAFSTTDSIGINLTLRETDIDTGIFSSNRAGEELTFNYTVSDEANRSLLVTKGDQIFASYNEVDVGAERTATAYYNEEAPFSDDVFLDPPCFIATAAYEESSYFDRAKEFLLELLSGDK
jgi:ligand-binding sensor domain-containing protein